MAVDLAAPELRPQHCFHVRRIPTQTAGEATKLSIALQRMVNTVDREIQLYAIRSLISLVSSYSLSNQIDLQVLEPLLSNTNGDVQVVTLYMILFVLDIRESKDFPAKIIEPTVRLFSPTGPLSSMDFRKILDAEYESKEHGSNEEDAYLFLDKLVGIVPAFNHGLVREQIRLLINEDIVKANNKSPKGEARVIPLFEELRKVDPRFVIGLRWQFIRCLVKTLLKLESNDFRREIKAQLIEALNKGTTHQQIWAIYLLEENFGSENDVIEAILGKFGSPFSAVRDAAISSLPRLKLNAGQLDLTRKTLQEALVDLSRAQRLRLLIAETFAGHGHLGLTDMERASIAEVLPALENGSKSSPTPAQPSATSASRKGKQYTSSYDFNFDFNHGIIQLSAFGSQEEQYLLALANQHFDRRALSPAKENADSRLTDDEISIILAFLERECTKPTKDRSRENAIAMLIHLSKRYGERVKDKAIPIFSELASTLTEDRIGFEALKGLIEFSPPPAAGSEHHKLLLTYLSSRQYSIASSAFEMLLRSQLV